MKWFFINFLITQLSFANLTPTDPSAFEIDPNLLNEVYRSETSDVRVASRYSTGGIEVKPLFSFLTAEQLELSNQYFRVPYGNSSQFPSFSVTIGTPFLLWNGVELSADLSVRYGYREAVYDVQSKAGANLRDLVALHWLPLSGGVRIGYRITFLPFMKPFAFAGGGAQWLLQSGRLDGISQNFWIPFVTYGGGLNLFDLSSQGDHWFGGICLGFTSIRSVESTQALRAYALDLGATLIL